MSRGCPTDPAMLEAAARAGARAAAALGKASGAASKAAVSEVTNKIVDVASPATTKATESSLNPDGGPPGFVDPFGLLPSGGSPSASGAEASGADESRAYRELSEMQERTLGSFTALAMDGNHMFEGNIEKPPVQTGFVPNAQNVLEPPGNFYEHPVIESAEFSAILGSLEEADPPWVQDQPGREAPRNFKRNDEAARYVNTLEDEGSVSRDDSISPRPSSQIAPSRFASWDYYVAPPEARVRAVAETIALKAEEFIPPPMPLSIRVLELPQVNLN